MGVILFQFLTGKLPFETRPGLFAEVLGQAVHDRKRVPSLRAINPKVTPATQAIVKRCLEPLPAKRYQSADELLDDIERQLDDRPLKYAKNPSWLERTAKWFRRHPRLTSSSSVAFFSILVLFCVGLLWHMRESYVLSLEASRHYTEFKADYPETIASLSVPIDDPQELKSGLESASELLTRFRVQDDSNWQKSDLFLALSPENQRQLRRSISSVLFLMAAHQASWHEWKSDVEQIRIGLDWNEKAIDSLPKEDVSACLLEQRKTLLQSLGESREEIGPVSQELASDYSDQMDRTQRAVELLLSHQLRSALSEFETLSFEHPSRFVVWFRLGICQYQLQQFGAAESSFSTCLALSPQSLQARYWRGLSALKLKSYEAARGDFDHLVDVPKYQARVLVCRGLCWQGLQQWRHAVAAYSAAIDAGFPQTRIYFLRANCYKNLGEEELARSDRESGLNLTPTDSLSWVARGMARISEQPEEAMQDFRSAVDLNPYQFEAYRNMAFLLSEKLSRPAEAIQVLDEMLALTADDPLAWTGRGVLHARMKNTDQARSDALKAMEISQSPMVLYQSACIFALTENGADDIEQSVRYLSQAFKMQNELATLSVRDPDLQNLRSVPSYRKLIAAFQIIQQFDK